MSDQIETKVVETENPAPPPVVDVKDLEDKLEQIKKAQAGSDKAYQEAAKKASILEAENEKLKKEKMSEKEKHEYEMAKRQAELEKQAKEVADATLRLSKMRLLGEKQIDSRWGDFINGESEEKLIEQMNTFNKLVNEEVEKRVNDRLSGTTKPQVGKQTEIQPLVSDWREIEKRYQGR